LNLFGCPCGKDTHPPSPPRPPFFEVSHCLLFADS
jgi:hypothetical protein